MRTSQHSGDAVQQFGRMSRVRRSCGSRRPSGSCRAGLTLLEVLISVAIFLSSLAAIMQLLAIGKRSEMMTRLQTEAVMRCETLMAEVVSGVQELKDVTDQPFPDNESSGTWQWSLQSVESGTTGLLQITISVQYEVGSETVTAFSLTRYLRDPQLFIDAALSGTGS